MNPSSEQLLATFASERAEAAFHELVRRHLPLVYSTAVRVTNGDKHLAEDISQTVFRDLAQKAQMLSGECIVAGWLHQHAWFLASKAIRTERRRQIREQETLAMQDDIQTMDGTDSAEIRSMLDEALTALKPEDRDALVLRYFEEIDLRRIGEMLGVSEDTAQKRVARALEKLRGVLMARGVTVSAATLVTFLSGQGLAAPATLATSISSSALAVVSAGAAAGLSSFLWGTKAKVAVAAAVALGIGAPLVWQQRSIHSLRSEIARLSPLVSSNELLRVENEELRKQTISAADVEEINRQFLELQRLRGEVTLLRKQAAEAAARAAKSGTEVKEDETTKEAQEISQVVLEARVAEMSHDRMATLLTSGFPTVADPKNFTLKIDRERAAAVLRLFEESGDVELLTAPRVTTVDGREARVSVVDALALPDVTSGPSGLEIGYVPTVMPDKESIHLKIDVKATEFLGWENESKLPRYRVRSVEHQETLWPGEVALVGRTMLLGEGESRETKLQVYFFSGAVIDAAGNLMTSRENGKQ